MALELKGGVVDSWDHGQVAEMDFGFWLEDWVFDFIKLIPQI